MGQTGDVHRGVRARSWLPMGAWSSLDTYRGGADWGRPRGHEGEVLGAHGGAWSSLDTYGGGADWERPRGREGEVLGAHGGIV